MTRLSIGENFRIKLSHRRHIQTDQHTHTHTTKWAVKDSSIHLTHQTAMRQNTHRVTTVNELHKARKYMNTTNQTTVLGFPLEFF